MIGSIALIVIGAAAFSAFESHIINVTARIENALLVEEEAIDFGTVFPQELLEETLRIAMSDSFFEEPRVDDIEYVIKQKPKVKGGWRCGEVEIPAGNGPLPPGCDPNENPFPGDPYATIFIYGDQVGMEEPPVIDEELPAWQYCEEYLPVDAPYGIYNPDDPYWRYCYLPLANYLSKHKAIREEGENDTEVDAFHIAYVWDGEAELDEQWIAGGRLAKSDDDIDDLWVIDLATRTPKRLTKGDFAVRWLKHFFGGHNLVPSLRLMFVQEGLGRRHLDLPEWWALNLGRPEAGVVLRQ